ncbi:hypothetical protein FHS96_001620 [Sphingomonas zeicaulis]|uniref:hypothetical protein n=1 Tax=Sphingomonas zeicaulis TaxID=1632740 RepID=UPI003D24B15E
MPAAFALLAAAAPSIGSAGVLPTNSQVEAEKSGSRYVQCDGYPNNMTAGESAARLLGAVTLLALFAPPPESADTSKRKFGVDGVAVCTGLLEGETGEGHRARRMGLILARAAHHIEAKNYDAGLADVAMARRGGGRRVDGGSLLGAVARPQLRSDRGGGAVPQGQGRRSTGDPATAGTDAEAFGVGVRDHP